MLSVCLTLQKYEKLQYSHKIWDNLHSFVTNGVILQLFANYCRPQSHH